LPGTDATAYLAMSLVTNKSSLKTLAIGVNVFKPFFFVADAFGK